MKRIEITLQGTAIAKWARMRVADEPKKFMNLDLRGKYVVTRADLPVIIEMDDQLQVPHMDRHSQISLSILPNAIRDCEELDTGQLAITAICLLQEQGVPVGECDKMELRILDSY